MANKMKRAMKGAKNDAAKVLEGVRAETAKAIAGAKEQVAPALEIAKAGTEKAVQVTQKTVEKTMEKTAEQAARAKNAVERAAKKAIAGEAIPVVYVQYMGGEQKVDDLVAAAQAAFSREHSRTKVTDLRLYIKPEDRAAYYVINEKFAGRVDF